MADWRDHRRRLNVLGGLGTRIRANPDPPAVVGGAAADRRDSRHGRRNDPSRRTRHRQTQASPLQPRSRSLHRQEPHAVIVPLKKHLKGLRYG